MKHILRSKRTPERMRRSNGDATKQKLIDIALELCREYGYDAVTSLDITRVAGTNLAAVNYHFGNLQGLFDAVEKIEHIPSYAEWRARAKVSELSPAIN